MPEWTSTRTTRTDGWGKSSPVQTGVILFCLGLGGCGDSTGPAGNRALVFTVEPTSTVAGIPFSTPVAVAVRADVAGKDGSWSRAVTVSLEASGSGVTLEGTTTVRPVGGVAVFDDLLVSTPGSNLRLVAVSGDLDEAASQPFSVVDVFRSRSSTAGQEHTCALKEDGTAYCWGANEYGQLGNGGVTGSPLPTPVSGELRFVSLSAGGGHTCGLTAAGEAYCWGENHNGQLGAPTPEECPPGGFYTSPCSTTPIQVSGGHLWSDLSTGRSHSCGLTLGGEAYCWGGNYWGQVGDGTQDDRASPTRPKGDLVFSTIKAGYLHTCALTPNGQAHCWGYNGYGEVGDSTFTPRYEPSAVHGGHHFLSIFPGGGSCHGHTCGITTNGDAYCWGRRYIWSSSGVWRFFIPVPEQLMAPPRFEDFAVGGYSVCGLTAEGELYCWGHGSYRGGVGDGEVTDRTEPIPIRPDLSFTSASSGRYHTCAVAISGETYCWGLNTEGQLGSDSNSFGWTVPVPVWGVPGG